MSVRRRLEKKLKRKDFGKLTAKKVDDMVEAGHSKEAKQFAEEATHFDADFEEHWRKLVQQIEADEAQYRLQVTEGKQNG